MSQDTNTLGQKRLIESAIKLSDIHYYKSMDIKFDSLVEKFQCIKGIQPKHKITKELRSYLRQKEKNDILIGSFFRGAQEHKPAIVGVQEKNLKEKSKYDEASNDLLYFYTVFLKTRKNNVELSILENLSTCPIERNQFMLHKFYELIYVSQYSIFEDYLYDICSKILTIKPDLTEKVSLSLNNVNSLQKKSKLQHYFIRESLFKIGRSSQTYRKFLKKSLNMNFDKINKDDLVSKWDQTRETRNCIVHSRGLITKENYSRLGYSRDAIDGKISIGLLKMLELDALFFIANAIDMAVCHKFGDRFSDTEEH